MIARKTRTIGHPGWLPLPKRRGRALRNTQWLSQAQMTTQRELSHPIPFSSSPQPASETAPHSWHPPQPCPLPGGPVELLVTEAAHVRMLRVLHDLFYQPMADSGFFPLEELQNIFPNLDELIEVHCECRASAPLHTPPLASSFEASGNEAWSPTCSP